MRRLVHHAELEDLAGSVHLESGSPSPPQLSTQSLPSDPTSYVLRPSSSLSLPTCCKSTSRDGDKSNNNPVKGVFVAVPARFRNGNHMQLSVKLWHWVEKNSSGRFKNIYI